MLDKFLSNQANNQLQL